MLKHLARWFQGPSPRHTAKKRKPQVRLRVTRLEDRLVPTVFNVNSLADLSLSPGVNNATGAIIGTSTVTLRSAIEAANATPGGNTINLNVAGTYKSTLVGTPGEVDNLAGEFAISSAGGNLTILNNSGGNVAVDGNNLNRVLDINPLFTVGNATVTASGSNYTGSSNVTFSGGGGTGATGTLTLGANGTITAVTITNPGSNYTSDPTATINANGNGTGATALAILTSPKITVTMQGFTIQNGLAQPGDGAAGSGGGIRDQGNASLTLTNIIITNNSASADGGGISMENTLSTPWTLTINGNSTISNNHAGDAGGGIEEDGTGHVNINAGTVITNNTSVNQGAGIWLDAIQQNAVASAVVDVGGSNYTSVPTVTFSGGGGTTQATGTADLSVGSVTVNTGGSNYTSVPTIGFSGGGGSGAAATAILGVSNVTTPGGNITGSGYSSVPVVQFSGGNATTEATGDALLGVSNVTITNPGSNYTASSNVTFSGGGGSGAAGTLNLSNGTVTGVTITNPGSNYTSDPTVTINANGNGTGATATDSLGVTRVIVLTSGSGYLSLPTVSFLSGGGSGATVTPVLSVISVNVTTGGAGYTSQPTVMFSGGGGNATQATGTAFLQVDAVNITTGGAGYVAPPAIAFTGGNGTGAAATANLTFLTANLNVTGTVISDNKAGGDGGGIGNAGNGTVTIGNSTVSNNSSLNNGGGFADENAVDTLNVSNSIFISNTATEDGGGFFVGGPTATITNTSIRDNSSQDVGGGIADTGTTLTVSACTIVGNTAQNGGGGIELETTGTGAAGSTITNSTITANQALNNGSTADGGGIDAPAEFTGSVALLNDTINANFADNGGGVFWAGTTGSTFTVQNTIIAKNTASTTGPDADNPAGTFTDNGGNLIGVAGTGSGNNFTSTILTGTVAMPLDPLLGPLQNNGGPAIGAFGNLTLNTEALSPFPLPGSLAIDMGVAAGAPATDERGEARPDGIETQPDIGAFETQDLTGNDAFVEALYRDFLHRLGDLTNPNDALGWVNALDEGTVTDQQVVTGISQSPEALGIVVDGLYLKILQRPSDPTGRAGFVNFLENGGTVEQVISNMAASPEYATDTGNTDSGFVQGLYNVLLGRTGSAGEVNGWLGVLPLIGRAGVVNGFLSSTEYRMDEVQQLYGLPLAALTSVPSVFPDLLHRAASPAEIASWVNSGELILQLEVSFASGPEYFNLASTLTGGVFV